LSFSPSSDLNNSVYLTRDIFVYTSSLSCNTERPGLIPVIPAAPSFIMFPVSAHVFIVNLPSLTPQNKALRFTPNHPSIFSQHDGSTHKLTSTQPDEVHHALEGESHKLAKRNTWNGS
jgi:hypothetical protein